MMAPLMNYSVREFRHITNRFLHARGAQRHMVNPVRDVLTFAQARGFDALTELERTQYQIAGFEGQIQLRSASTWTADGQAAYYVAPTIVDLLVLRSSEDVASVTIENVSGPAVFRSLDEYAQVRGLHLEVTAVDDDSVTLAYRAVPRPMTSAPVEAEGPAVRDALKNGFNADIEQFWRMFYASDQALTPDSEVSRNHAGSQIYDEHGNVIGEFDEESYTYIRSYADEVAG